MNYGPQHRAASRRRARPRMAMPRLIAHSTGIDLIAATRGLVTPGLAGPRPAERGKAHQSTVIASLRSGAMRRCAVRCASQHRYHFPRRSTAPHGRASRCHANHRTDISIARGTAARSDAELGPARQITAQLRRFQASHGHAKHGIASHVTAQTIRFSRCESMQSNAPLGAAWRRAASRGRVWPCYALHSYRFPLAPHRNAAHRSALRGVAWRRRALPSTSLHS